VIGKELHALDDEERLVRIIEAGKTKADIVESEA
jgi:hypothetical protein